jgi:AcrR family transcriptional regulator
LEDRLPKQTFWNLPEEKRAALIALSLDEFAEHDYQSASVSRIVARAGIAKGSVYQYFADKQELFLFLVDIAAERLLAFVSAAEPPASDGFFALLRRQMSATTLAALAHPREARLLVRAYTGDLPFAEELARRADSAGHEHLGALVRRASERGELAVDADPALVEYIVRAVTGGLGPFLVARLRLRPEQLAAGDIARLQAPDVEQIFDSVALLLERGIGRGR